MGGRDGYLFGILIEPSCSHIFRIRLTATPDKAPCTIDPQTFYNSNRFLKLHLPSVETDSNFSY